MSGDPLNYTYFSSATPSPTWSWATDTDQHPPPAMPNGMQGYTLSTFTPSPTVTGLVDPNANLSSPPFLDMDMSMPDGIPASWLDVGSFSSQNTAWDADQGGTHPENDDASRRKRHTCPYCLRQMTRRHNLKVHMETHLPNRPRRYVCLEPGCGRQYTRKHDHKRHMDTHHGRQLGAASTHVGGA